jgi:tetratricopeptide (TPR) repeat protein
MLAIMGLSIFTAAFVCSCKSDSCEDVIERRNWTRASTICLDAYHRTGRPADGAAAARSLLVLEKFDEAEQIARQLTTSDRAGDALMALASTEARRPDSDLGLARYREALATYLRTNHHAGASRAAHELARVWLLRGDLHRATQASQLAIDEAEHGGDLVMQQYAWLGHSELMRQQGLLVAAEKGLARVAGLSRTPQDLAWVAILRGILYIEMELDGLARAELDRVQQLAASAPIPPSIRLAAHLDLAWVDRRAGELRRAMAHVDEAAKIDADDVDVHVNRALVLADQGLLDDAAAELQRAADDDDGRTWWVAYNQGLVASKRGDVPGELAAFQRSSEAVRERAQGAGALASDLAASHRQPFLRLIGVHARAGRWIEALRVVMQLDALALLATERAPPASATGPGAERAAPAAAPPSPTLEPAAVLAAWSGRSLSILVSDEVSLWRLDVRDGEITGQVVGPAASLEKLARALETAPDDPSIAATLGTAIVSPAAASSPAPLELLLIGPIARAPLAALTRDGRYLSDRTPLARVLGVLPRRKPASSTPHPGAAVFGDPRDDLPNARAEAIAVAAALNQTPILGSAATGEALLAASAVGILHVAAHSLLDPQGPLLLLAKSNFSRAELLAQPTAPSVVVLASCGGAVARDDSGWGSLAGAYLAVGSDVVIASAWSVDDASTRRFVEQLYRNPGAVRTDPIGALAAAQAATRAALPARAWASFTAIAAPPYLSPQAM